VLHEIARLRAAGMAVVFSSHHPDHALRIADRALLLKEGHALAAGDTRATVTSANLSALYGCGVEVLSVTAADGTTAHACFARDGGHFG
jgi:iron complex transport system ATP-binding protein